MRGGQRPHRAAFAVFTEQFGNFKPREHNLLGVAIAETVFERRVGGHIYDRGVDGSVCRWARILAYEPPDRVVFSWVDRHGPGWQSLADGVGGDAGWPLYLDRYGRLFGVGARP